MTLYTFFIRYISDFNFTIITIYLISSSMKINLIDNKKAISDIHIFIKKLSLFLRNHGFLPFLKILKERLKK